MKRTIPRILMVIIATILYLAGCSTDREKENGQFNLINNRASENENFIFYIRSIGDERQITAQEKATGHRFKVVRNPFESISFVVNNPFYVNNNFLYYLKTEHSHTQGGLFNEKLSFVEINLETFEETIIHQKDLRLQKSKFLGAITSEASLSNQTMGLGFNFFIYDQFIYMLSPTIVNGTEILRINTKTGVKESLLYSPSQITQMASNGDHIYYLDNRMRVVSFNIETKEEKILPDILSRNISLLNNELFFINAQDNGTIYAMNLEDYKLRKITENTAYSFHGDGEHIYYSNEDDNHYLYRIDFDGKNNQKIAEITTYEIAVFQNHSELHLNTIDGMYVVNKETHEMEPLD